MSLDSVQRVLRTLEFKKVDRVPIWESFWPETVLKWSEHLHKLKQISIHEYLGIDLKFRFPRIAPQIDTIKIIREDTREIIYRNEWGCVVKVIRGQNLPGYLEFPIKTFRDLEKYKFVSAQDLRRYQKVGAEFDASDESVLLDDMRLIFGPRSFEEETLSNRSYCLFGGVLGPFESMWRMRGMNNLLIDMKLDSGFVHALAARVTGYMIEVGITQIEKYNLPGIWIADDVSYEKGMFFSLNFIMSLFFLFYKRCVSNLRN